MGVVARLRTKVGKSLPRPIRNALASSTAKGRAALYKKEGRPDKAALMNKWSDEILKGKRKLRESREFLDEMRKRSKMSLATKEAGHRAMADNLEKTFKYHQPKNKGEHHVLQVAKTRFDRLRKAQKIAARYRIAQYGANTQLTDIGIS